MDWKDRLLLIAIAAALAFVAIDKFNHCDPESCPVHEPETGPGILGRP